jgi:hypothetical protein
MVQKTTQSMTMRLCCINTTQGWNSKPFGFKNLKILGQQESKRGASFAERQR